MDSIEPERDPRSTQSHRCPICDQPFRPEESPALPFCSQRCRTIDLGRWLDERYGLEASPPEEEEGEEPPKNPDEAD